MLAVATATMLARRTAWRNKRRLLPKIQALIGPDDKVTAGQVYDYMYQSGRLIPANFALPAVVRAIQYTSNPPLVIGWVKADPDKSHYQVERVYYGF